ncbi:MAG TPA: acyltransferase [Candidatus Coprenecus stercoravium]|uniref:Acyltransferase n=1 Tax=Candidatus Coprenecus stercoravium TaxID=2840735 RepID=A0A9D2GQI9_9BACT|nr:acyltransferase [Candidatus Coprenecus stercoravium]
MDAENDILSIDVEKVIRSKSPKLADRLPRFILNYIKRTIHQDEINRLLLDNSMYTGADFATHILQDMNVSYNVHYTGHAPDPSGRYIFVSNHPLGGLDGMILISYISSRFGDVKFIVNDLLMFIKPLAPVFVPVNKYGKMRHDNTLLFHETFDSDAQILYFPAGLCSRLIHGQVTDLDWKKTFVTKAVESRRDIVPMFFSGENSRRFYRLANMRKKLGIKVNIETFFLPDEMFRQKGAAFDLFIGEPIPYTSITEEHSHKEWCDIIRQKCYATRNQAR